jgi:L-lactate dehydrogenase complex protein LldE
MPYKPPVALFVQCLADALRPEIPAAVVRLFRRFGVSFEVPDRQTCCGQPAFNAGYRKAARRAAKAFMETFSPYDHIVCPSGSCVAMIRHHYPALFAEDPKQAAAAGRFAGRTFELTTYLTEVLGVTDTNAAFSGVVTVHDSCHALRLLGIREQPRRLLAGVRGLTLREMDESDRCCGFGGAFSVKYPDISAAMAEYKARRAVESGADTLTGVDLGCLLHLEGYFTKHRVPVRVRHIAEILAPA